MKIILLITIAIINILEINGERNFTIDYPNNQFLKDGIPFQYVSGSLNYFRVPSALWRDRMVKLLAAGLNAVETYVEWSSHEPEKGEYNFCGDLDLIRFLEIAQEVGLLVILRPGPYICAERENGGFPYWLKSINPNMELRTSDPTYLAEVDAWYAVLLPKLVPMLYKNGGPIIKVQIENEYGSTRNFACDFAYAAYLRDLTAKYLGNDALLFTTDGPGDYWLQCGKIDNVFATIDFGPGANVKQYFDAQHVHQQFGPNVNSEYYSGWLDHWENPHEITGSDIVSHTLDEMLALNSSVNIFMFHGGTSFGFGSGANFGNTYEPCPTSYDYDAPLNEAGDPTPKYYAIREIIGKYLPLPNVSVPIPSQKMELPPINMTPVTSIFDDIYLEEPIPSLFPLTFEELQLGHGFILYSTNITLQPTNPALLTISGLADRALVFVDKEYSGTLSRTWKVFQLPINAQIGSQLDIFVENQGRVGYGPLVGELKGITSNVTLGSVTLLNWNHYKFFGKWDKAVQQVQKYFDLQTKNPSLRKFNRNGIPTFFAANFTLTNDPSIPLDTFLRLDGWRKGLAFLNGFNLGRYWPIAGPQITLYAPAPLFNRYPQSNSLVIFELEGSPCNSQDSVCSVQFVKDHVIDGPTPHSELYKKSKRQNYRKDTDLN